MKWLIALSLFLISCTSHESKQRYFTDGCVLGTYNALETVGIKQGQIKLDLVVEFCLESGDQYYKLR